MKKPAPAIIALGISFFFLYHSQEDKTAKTLQGTVVSSTTRSPVSNAFVYVIEGEEEALTNAKGDFKLETFQSFPLTITVQREHFKKTKVKVAAPGQKLVIAIEPDR